MILRRSRRPAVAAVEFAVTFPFLLTLMIGVWEVGRLIQAYQVLTNASREGARLAAQGKIVNVTGTYTQIMKSTGTPNVTTTVKNYISAAGFNATNANISFTFLDSSGNPTGTPAQPWEGDRGQRFRVTTTLPYADVRLTTLGIVNITTMTAVVDWVSMNDDPFTINTAIPSWSP